MSSNTPKNVANELINSLPDEATWDDVIYEIITRREIDLGLEDSDANRITPVEDVIKEFSVAER